MLARGGTIGRYVILDVLGEGGMGIVYAAFDPQLDRKVAIKTVQSARAGREARERALREAQAMAKLAHPNVVTVHDVGEVNDEVFIAMELVDGVTLDAWLAKEPLHDWRARLATMKFAGRGLAAAHAAGIIHRDFKPGNVLVGNDGRTRVTDFGIARSSAQADSVRRVPAAGALLDQPLTETGSILGTVGYMAPEQAFGEEATARSDQFSFCVALYLALYGEKPFVATTIAEYTDAVAAPVREPPGDTKVPSWLRRVVLRGLRPAPEERFPSMAALLAALDRDPGRSRRSWIAVAAVLALGTAGIFRFASQRNHACDAAVPSLAGIWDAAVKREMHDAFIATAAPNAEDAWSRASTVLDAYSNGIASMRVDACRAAKIDHVQSPDDHQRRDDCLDRRTVELGALTALFRRPDPQLVDSATKATYELASLSWCADLRGLRANEGLPDDPAKRVRAVEARRGLAEARALLINDRSKDALPIAERVIAEARATADERTEAEALLVAGSAQHRQGDDAAAQRSLIGAVVAGSASSYGQISVRAAALLAYVVGVDLQRGEEARDWIARARRALEKMGGNEELEVFVASREASILHGFDHRPELAAPIFERTAAAYRRLLGVHPNTQRELKNLGDVYIAQGRRDLALERYRDALAMAETLYGAESMQTGIALAAVGDAQLKTGDLTAGTEALERGLVIAEHKRNTFWIVAILQELTRAATRAGDAKRALTLGERAVALSHSPVLAPASYVTTAEALLTLGRPVEAIDLCQRALDMQTSSIAPERVYEWDALRCVGEALLATGRARDALAPLERSASLDRREWPGDLALARFALSRALVATNGDAARARLLAEQARGEVALLPDQKALLLAIDMWLRGF